MWLECEVPHHSPGFEQLVPSWWLSLRRLCKNWRSSLTEGSGSLGMGLEVPSPAPLSIPTPLSSDCRWMWCISEPLQVWAKMNPSFHRFFSLGILSAMRKMIKYNYVNSYFPNIWKAGHPFPPDLYIYKVTIAIMSHVHIIMGMFQGSIFW